MGRFGTDRTVTVDETGGSRHIGKGDMAMGVDMTWDEVGNRFGVDGSELCFSPNGPDVETVAVLRHDMGDGLDVEVQMFTGADEARDVAAFIETVGRETSDVSDERICRDVIGIDPEDAEAVRAYRDDIEAVRRVYGTWRETARSMV